MDKKYFKVSWLDGQACILLDDIDEAKSQFHYECVFEDRVKLETLTKEEYESEIQRIDKKVK